MKVLPNRLAVYLTAAAGLLTALAPVVANFDVSSTVGIVGGFAGIAAVVHKWLDGWQQHEYREADEIITPDPEVAGLTVDVPAPDVGDAGQP